MEPGVLSLLWLPLAIYVVVTSRQILRALAAITAELEAIRRSLEDSSSR
jgi:hypothetical protein